VTSLCGAARGYGQTSSEQYSRKRGETKPHHVSSDARAEVWLRFGFQRRYGQGERASSDSRDSAAGGSLDMVQENPEPARPRNVVVSANLPGILRGSMEQLSDLARPAARVRVPENSRPHPFGMLNSSSEMKVADSHTCSTSRSPRAPSSPRRCATVLT
jgi:hypothetical protein